MQGQKSTPLQMQRRVRAQASLLDSQSLQTGTHDRSPVSSESLELCRASAAWSLTDAVVHITRGWRCEVCWWGCTATAAGCRLLCDAGQCTAEEQSTARAACGRFESVAHAHARGCWLRA